MYGTIAVQLHSVGTGNGTVVWVQGFFSQDAKFLHIKVFEWKKSILSVYENKDLFNKLSYNSRFDFLESYSWKSRAESILKILWKNICIHWSGLYFFWRGI